MMHVAVAGIDTDLGAAIAELVVSAPDMELTGGTSIANHHSGSDTGIVGLLDRSTALVDVTSPAEMMVNAIHCLSAGCALVGGSGPLDPNHLEELRDYSYRIPVFHAPDLCVENAALLALLPELCSRLPHLQAEITGIDRFRRRKEVTDLCHVSEPVIFLTSADQEIMLTQRVFSQAAAARGAIRALRLLSGVERGFFTMDDLLQTSAAPSGHQPIARVS